MQNRAYGLPRAKALGRFKRTRRGLLRVPSVKLVPRDIAEKGSVLIEHHKPEILYRIAYSFVPHDYPDSPLYSLPDLHAANIDSCPARIGKLLFRLRHHSPYHVAEELRCWWGMADDRELEGHGDLISMTFYRLTWHRLTYLPYSLGNMAVRYP